MSSFNIIQLQKEPLNEDNALTEEDINKNNLVCSESDYLRGTVDNDVRRDIIRRELPGLFEGIATVDPEKETVTFLSRDTIRQTLQREIATVTARLMEEATKEEPNMFFRKVRLAGERFRGCQDMFHIDYPELSGQFFQDAEDRHGMTYYVGAIISAHC